MALSVFGSLTREFYIVEIGTWENYGGKRVWRFIGGRYIEVLLYALCFFAVPICSKVLTMQNVYIYIYT